jgi:peptidyl-prolyl cis-trans isomerase D
LLYQITKINNLLPNKNDTSFRDKVKNRILLKKKFDLNKNLFEKIQNKDFNDSDFENLVKNKENINSGIINSINDVSLFDETSLKLIYELPKNSFVMVSNRANNIFLAKINQITYENLKSTNENIQEYLAKTNINLIDDIYSSYDTSLNTKYEVKIFNNNIDRIKDYFK